MGQRIRTIVQGWAIASAVGLLAPSDAAADQLSVEQADGEEGYRAVEELSYETIVDASPTYEATLRIRVALHNTSRSQRDLVHSLALPAGARLSGISVARNGKWTTGTTTSVRPKPARRDPGTVFARELEPASVGDIPGAELAAFGVAPGATIQIELAVAVFPRLRGDRWELDLPSRGPGQLAMAKDRRVIVRGLRNGEEFLVDETPNGKARFMLTRAEDTVTVAWPSHMKSKSTLDGRYEITAGPPGFDDGEFRLYLRLGSAAALKPDHVVVLVDSSRSTSPNMHHGTARMLNGLFDALPASTTFDALAFNRKVVPLLDDLRGRPKVSDRAARRALSSALEATDRGQGTDVAAALAAAATANRSRRARRPLIVVVTDGMLPASVRANDIQHAFDKALGKRRRPDILFVVDDPVLLRSGLVPAHPVARTAAALGARISLKTLSSMGPHSAAELLTAPRVLGGLKLDLPQNMVLEDLVPVGLVAGNFVGLRGRYVGKPARSVTIHGQFGSQKIARPLRAQPQARPPDALVAVTSGDLDDAKDEGYALPPWYRPGQRTTAQQGIAQAGRIGGEQHGYLDKKVFRHYLTTRVLPRARVCYNHAVTRFGGQEGRVVLEMEVGKGEVMLASAKPQTLKRNDDKLIECMTEAAWALDIPAGKLDDQVYVIRYPLRLIPPPETGGNGQVVRLSEDDLEVLFGGDSTGKAAATPPPTTSNGSKSPKPHQSGVRLGSNPG